MRVAVMSQPEIILRAHYINHHVDSVTEQAGGLIDKHLPYSYFAGYFVKVTLKLLLQWPAFLNNSDIDILPYKITLIAVRNLYCDKQY
jgi:hypothetical protein